ncbi:hypothetical protein HA402_014572 [Bradysia odoriphaga]|nr:hypothetical protein HA402_014572 [Bradysia odoriphaga]
MASSSNMAKITAIRHSIQGSPICVSYGYDEITGVFLSVEDNRLKYDRNASDEINNVFLNTGVLGLESGDGAYLDMHTGDIEVGIRVSWPVMSEYLKRYGVSRNHIQDLMKKNIKHEKKWNKDSA